MLAFNGDLVILEIKVSIELERMKEKRAGSLANVTLVRECMEIWGDKKVLWTTYSLYLSVKWVNSTYLIGCACVCASI